MFVDVNIMNILSSFNIMNILSFFHQASSVLVSVGSKEKEDPGFPNQPVRTEETS